jgi:hypothetical protein
MRHDGEDQAQEPERIRFYHLDHSWSFDGEDHAISVAAYKLHINSTADATLRGHPGFVPDEYLNSLGTETTITVIDLVSLRIAHESRCLPLGSSKRLIPFITPILRSSNRLQ